MAALDAQMKERWRCGIFHPEQRRSYMNLLRWVLVAVRKQCDRGWGNANSAPAAHRSTLAAGLVLATRQRALTGPVWWSLLSAALTLPVVAADIPQPAGEKRDLLLMLDSGPVHIRVHVLVGKKSPTAARKAAIDRLLQTLDADGDGKL